MEKSYVSNIRHDLFEVHLGASADNTSKVGPWPYSKINNELIARFDLDHRSCRRIRDSDRLQGIVLYRYGVLIHILHRPTHRYYGSLSLFDVYMIRRVRNKGMDGILLTNRLNSDEHSR
jgi:hypothetical protein